MDVAFTCPAYDTSVLTLVGTISPKLTYPVLLPNIIELTVNELINPLPTFIEEAVNEDVMKLLDKLVEKLEKNNPLVVPNPNTVL